MIDLEFLKVAPTVSSPMDRSAISTTVLFPLAKQFMMHPLLTQFQWYDVKTVNTARSPLFHTGICGAKSMEYSWMQIIFVLMERGG